jgi:hypothetical protein
MQIKTEIFCVNYDNTTATVTFEGKIFLNGSQKYSPLLQLLKQAAAQEIQAQKKLVVDLRHLRLLNSSGITMMTKFIMYVFEEECLELEITFVGQKAITWHQKLLENFITLQPDLRIRLE